MNTTTGMTEQEFRKANKPVRCFQVFDSETRMNHAASHKLGHRARVASGEYYYIHPLVPGLAFPTAKAAHRMAWQKFQEGK